MNWIAIAVAAVFSMVLGFIWYNPKVFGKIWMAGSGMTEEKAKEGNMPVTFGVSFLLAGVVSYFLSTYGGYHEAHEQTFSHGMLHGAMAAGIFALPPLVTNALYEQKGLAYMFVVAGYWVVFFAIAGGIVFAWR
jgi:hypothetical protein